jgi:hypothetical protein
MYPSQVCENHKAIMSILVMVDWFSKLAHMVLTMETATALEITKLFSMHGGNITGC